ncbi:TetR/AcrR family transcriptional regulator [Blastococcus sp. SYSU D00669]
MALPEPVPAAGSNGARPGGRQKQRSDLSTRRLLEASAALISERGFERTTLADIGRRAGYSHGLVTRKFGSKANLLSALVERMTERFGPDRLAETVGHRSGLPALTHVVTVIRQEAERSPTELRAFYALMFEGIKPTSELHLHLRGLNRDFRGRLARFVADGIADGTVRAGADPHAVANLVTSAMRGIAYFWMLDPEEFDILAELDALSAQVAACLAPT